MKGIWKGKVLAAAGPGANRSEMVGVSLSCSKCLNRTAQRSWTNSHNLDECCQARETHRNTAHRPRLESFFSSWMTPVCWRTARSMTKLAKQSRTCMQLHVWRHRLCCLLISFVGYNFWLQTLSRLQHSLLLWSLTKLLYTSLHLASSYWSEALRKKFKLLKKAKDTERRSLVNAQALQMPASIWVCTTALLPFAKDLCLGDGSLSKESRVQWWPRERQGHFLPTVRVPYSKSLSLSICLTCLTVSKSPNDIKWQYFAALVLCFCSFFLAAVAAIARLVSKWSV